MNQVDVIFNNGKIVTQGKVIEGFVAVNGEKIVAVGQGDHAPDARKIIDLKGRVLIPGVVDPEVHFGATDGLAMSSTRKLAAQPPTALPLGVHAAEHTCSKKSDASRCARRWNQIHRS